VGRDSILNKEYLLIGAHYDHLGIGMKLNGDSIYNGVLDNAVGTAIVLELARMFSQASFKPKRSIILAFFSGEEKGLLGSSYYTEHPPVAIKNTVAMLNVDGVSALGYFHSLIAVGGEYSELGLTLQSVAGEYGLEIEQVSAIDSENPFSKSDQLSFAQSGVPAIQVLEGYSYSEMSAEQAILKTRKWFNNIYHSPFDDLNQPIEYAAIERFTNILFAFCNRILNQDNIPQWYQSSPYQRKQ
jgi:Zn-dependent M28 family amino/carboxypeptidase